MSLPQRADVVIVGAGPAGLATALVLASQQVSFVIIDALVEGQNDSRAAVVHAHTLELLESVGAADALVEAGIHMRELGPVDHYERVITTVPLGQILDGHTKYPFANLIAQCEVEKILGARLRELGGIIHREKRVSTLREVEDGLEVVLESGEVIGATYVVGADGSKSTIRAAADIAFLDPRTQQPSVPSEDNIQVVLADVTFEEPLPPSVPTTRLWGGFDPDGFTVVIPVRKSGRDMRPGTDLYRVAMNVPPGSAPEQAGLNAEYFQRLLDTRGPGHSTGKTVRIAEVLTSSRYRVRSGLASQFYKRMGNGWVLLAGDSAHIHSPMGGQGMNLGLSDGIHLGRALVVGTEEGFKQYELKRRTAASEVIAFAEGLTRLAANTWLNAPVISTIRNWLVWGVTKIPGTATRAAWRVSGLVYRDTE